jgi:hypothetical protein
VSKEIEERVWEKWISKISSRNEKVGKVSSKKMEEKTNNKNRLRNEVKLKINKSFQQFGFERDRELLNVNTF